jgi:4-amino-4-deoxy-L-arabinose transferase-like glycosyltransferase
MIAALGVLALLAWERRSAWALPLLRPLGLLTAVVMVLPWTIAIGVATQGAFFSDAIGGDLGGKLTGGAEGHGAPPGLHLALLPLLSFPIVLGLPAAALLAWTSLRAQGQDPAAAPVRTLLAWIGPSWLVFELAPTKLAHYALPLYPALAVLAAAGLARLYDRGGWRLKTASTAVFLLAGAGLTAVCALAATQMYGDGEAGLRRAAQAGLTLGLPLLGAGVVIAATRRVSVAVAAALACSALLLTTARERIAPEARGLFASDAAAAALQREGLAPNRAGAGPPLLSIGFSEPSLVFLTRTDTRLRTGAQGAREAMEGQAALVEARHAQAFAAGLAARGLRFEAAGAAVRGLNYSKGDPVALQPGRIAPAEPRASPAPPQP